MILSEELEQDSWESWDLADIREWVKIQSEVWEEFLKHYGF